MAIKINDELVIAIEQIMMEKAEDKQELLHELARYRREFYNILDYNWYKYGNILPEYSQIRKFYKEMCVVAPMDNDLLQKHFEGHVRAAIDELVLYNKVK